MVRSAFLLVTLAACRIASIDLTGTPCPCPSDYRCEEATNTCTRTTVQDPDAAPDVSDGGFDLTRNLLYYFKLDQNSGQVITDSSPTPRAGWAASSVETMWTAGRVGNALKFNGVGYASYVFFPTSASTCGTPERISGSFTASAWAKFDSFHTANYSLGDVVAMHGSAGGQEGGWGIGASDRCGTTTASVSVQAPSNGPRVNRCGGTVLAPATWYHITGVYDAGAKTLDIYLNGVKDNGAIQGGVPASINMPPANQCMYLAASANQSNLLLGSIDEFRLYDRALTSAEVDALYRASQ
jgi:hypothetical protein